MNAVARLETDLEPRTLLAALLAIEQARGRVRTMRNGPRTLDLDILLYDSLECREPELTLPHPRMHERAFVLRPLLDVCPGCVIPGRGEAVTWLARCDSGQSVERLEA